MYRRNGPSLGALIICIIFCVIYMVVLLIMIAPKGNATYTESTYSKVRGGGNGGGNNDEHYTSGIYPPIDPQCVYWVPGGDVFHSTDKCTHISGKAGIMHGTIDEAIANGKTRPCSRCGGN